MPNLKNKPTIHKCEPDLPMLRLIRNTLVEDEMQKIYAIEAQMKRHSLIAKEQKEQKEQKEED